MLSFFVRGSNELTPYGKRLYNAIKLLQLVSGVRIKTGKVEGPFGTEIIGFKVTVSSALDPASVVRTYDDIDKILRSNKLPYREVETKNQYGKFKSFIVES